MTEILIGLVIVTRTKKIVHLKVSTLSFLYLLESSLSVDSTRINGQEIEENGGRAL